MDGVDTMYADGKLRYKYTCHPNGLEMMLTAYRVVIDDKRKGSWQSFTNYRTEDEDGGGPYTYIYYRSKAIRTPEGR